MIIAVNTRHLSDEAPESRGSFIFECFSRLAKKYPQHQFIYIFDKDAGDRFITSKNIISVVTGPRAISPIRWQYWYNYKVPSVLRKYKANVFVSTDGICSLRTKIPQCLLINDLDFVHHPQFFTKAQLRFYKRFTPKFLERSKSIATVSPFLQNEITERYGTNPGKIGLVFKAAGNIFKPVDDKEKELIKEKYAEGKEFFLYSGTIQPGKNLHNLLKAFSFFKKRQKSNMLLLIAGKPVPGYHQFTDDLRTFKFRNEVKLLDAISKEEQARITAAAYAMVDTALLDDFSTPCLEAMQSGVPVIGNDAGPMKGLFAAAALYADPADFKDIAEKMMLLFKDENKRSELINAGKRLAKQYDPDKTADLLWDSISKAIQEETA